MAHSVPTCWASSLFLQRARQLRWQVDAEYFWKHRKLAFGIDGFDARNNGHRNSGGTAFIHKIVVNLVVEEHLGDDVIGPGFNL